MATNKQDQNLMDGLWNAATDAADNATVAATEAVANVADKATEAVSNVGKTIEHTAENTIKEPSKQDIFDTLQEKNQPNLAASYAAISTKIDSLDIPEDKKAFMQAHLTETTLAQKYDIPAEHMKVAMNDQQVTREKELERA